MTEPIRRFKELLREAEALAIELANAAAVASTGSNNQPSVRMLLLKEVDERGFVFYTNVESRKGRQLGENAQAAACFWWPQLKRQARIEGRVELLSEKEADEYFASRPRGSQIGAWASNQSREIASRDELLAAVAAFEKRFRDRSVPRPSHWSGFRLVPLQIEFWQEQPNRLHERELYTRKGNDWKLTLLAP